MSTQIRGTSQIKDLTINWEKLEDNFLDGADLDITAGNADATITGLKLPTNNTDAATKEYVDQLVDGSLKTPEAYDASVNAYPATYGGAAIQAGDAWRITAAGTLGSRAVNVEDLLIALVDGAGADADFMVAESNRDQATETVKGVAEIATQTEADAGTNDTNIITPLKLSTYITNNNVDDNIYTTNGSLTSARTVDCNGNLLTLQGNLLFVGDGTGQVIMRSAQGVGQYRVDEADNLFMIGETIRLDATANGGRQIEFSDAETENAGNTARIPFAMQATTDYGNGNGTGVGDVIDQFRTEFTDEAVINSIVELKALIDTGANKIFEVDQEDHTLAADVASGATVYTLTNLGTHATVKVVFVKAYVNGILQKTADTTVDTVTGDISFNFDLVTGDDVSFVYSKQDA